MSHRYPFGRFPEFSDPRPVPEPPLYRAVVTRRSRRKAGREQRWDVSQIFGTSYLKNKLQAAKAGKVTRIPTRQNFSAPATGKSSRWRYVGSPPTRSPRRVLQPAPTPSLTMSSQPSPSPSAEYRTEIKKEPDFEMNQRRKEKQDRKEFEAALVLASMKRNWEFNLHARSTKPKVPPSNPYATKRTQCLPVQKPLGRPIPETRDGSLIRGDSSVTPRRNAQSPSRPARYPEPGGYGPVKKTLVKSEPTWYG